MYIYLSQVYIIPQVVQYSDDSLIRAPKVRKSR